MKDELIDVLRMSIADYTALVASEANPDCHICNGRGWTDNYIAPSKMGSCECPCTGYGYNRTVDPA